jgi:hypothetical protein
MPLPDITLCYWNVNFIVEYGKLRIDSKCCAVSAFPVVSKGKPTLNAGAWVLGEYADGRLKLVSVSGAVKDVTQVAAVAYFKVHGIANAVLSGDKLVGGEVAFMPINADGTFRDVRVQSVYNADKVAYEEGTLLTEKEMKSEVDANERNGWGFSSEQLYSLADEHQSCRVNGNYKRMAKIDYRLEDANFHTFGTFLCNGDYDGARKWIASDIEDSDTVSMPTNGSSPDWIKGKTFCVTGRIAFPGKRAALETYISSHGGFNVDKITHNVDYLITNDQDSGSRKNKDAVAYRVPIISENEFLRQVGYFN